MSQPEARGDGTMKTVFTPTKPAYTENTSTCTILDYLPEEQLARVKSVLAAPIDGWVGAWQVAMREVVKYLKTLVQQNTADAATTLAWKFVLNGVNDADWNYIAAVVSEAQPRIKRGEAQESIEDALDIFPRHDLYEDHRDSDGHYEG